MYAAFTKVHVCIYIVSQGQKLTAFDIKTKDAHEQLELLNKDHL